MRMDTEMVQDPKHWKLGSSSLKSEARRFLEKSSCTPCSESPLKLKRHIVQLLAIWKNCQWRTQLCQRPFIHNIQLLATGLWTNLEFVANSAEKFLQLECCFLCRQQCIEYSVILATAQWKFYDVAECKYIFHIPTCTLPSLCVACINVKM